MTTAAMHGQSLECVLDETSKTSSSTASEAAASAVSTYNKTSNAEVMSNLKFYNLNCL